VSVHVTSWAWRQVCPTSSAKLILLKLADSCNDLGVCWPSQKYLAEHCQMSERHVRRSIEELEKLDLLAVRRNKKTDGTWDLNVYTLSSGHPGPMEGSPADIQRTPASSETSIETKSSLRTPTSGGPCPQCGVTPPGTVSLAEHLENVHGVRAA